MSFHKNVKDLIDRYGSVVTITRKDKEISTKAFIEPLRHNTRVYRDMSVRFGGFEDSRYYLYIGQAGVKFYRPDDAIITCNGKQYVVHTSETYELMDKELYVWAVLKPYKKQRRDDYDTNRR